MFQVQFLSITWFHIKMHISALTHNVYAGVALLLTTLLFLFQSFKRLAQGGGPLPDPTPGDNKPKIQ